MNGCLVLPLLLLGVVGDASMTWAQSANTFTSAGDMSTPRVGHTATLLTNGKLPSKPSSCLVCNCKASVFVPTEQHSEIGPSLGRRVNLGRNSAGKV